MATTRTKLMIAGSILLAHAVDRTGNYHPEVLSGDGIFAAVGARIWLDSVHLLSRVGSDFPKESSKQLETWGIDTKGSVQLDQTIHPRIYYQDTANGLQYDSSATSFFRTIQKPVPKNLSLKPCDDHRHSSEDVYPDFAPRPEDIPLSLEKLDGALITSRSFLSSISLPVFLRSAGVPRIVLSFHNRFLEPDFKDRLSLLLTGISAALLGSPSMVKPAGKQLEELIPWMESLCGYGCANMVITNGASGQILLDHQSHTIYQVPAYPARVVDVMGARAAFSGGFLAGLAQTDDPLEAVIHGSVSASLVIEGTPAFHALETLPGLARARLDYLRDRTRKVEL